MFNMTDFASLLPKHPVLYPMLFVFLVYGLRYLIFAGALHFLVSDKWKRPLGRTHIPRPAKFDFALHLKRELRYSLTTLLIFALINAVLFGYGLIASSQMYWKVKQFPWWWFWLSIPVMLILHDSFFYWMHRAIHSPRLFHPIHKLHHESLFPTGFAAYSFSLGEAALEALIVTAIIFIIPTHPLAFLIFQTISTAYNVYGHCGRELYPQGMHQHWLGRWINTSTLHAHHHRYAKGNYGLYFTFWDRWLGTIEPPSGPQLVRQDATH
jgi:Delta7-sterol 5-desaturase